MKKLFALLAIATGMFLSAAAPVLDGSSDEALTQSLVKLWISLDDKACDEFGCATMAAAKKLDAMDSAERGKLLNGKTAEDFMKIAQQLSPEDYEENMALHARFGDADRAATAKAMRKALAGVNPETGLSYMIMAARYVFVNAEGGPAIRLISDQLRNASDEQVAEFAAMQTVRGNTKDEKLKKQLLSINISQGNQAAIAKAKELAPAEFDAALKDILSRNSGGKLAESAEKLRAKYAKKADMLGAWLAIYNLDWSADFEAAKQRAAAEGRPMFVLFTRSDPLPPSKLESEILASPEFADFAAGNLVLVYVDFPEQEALLSSKQTAANKSMAEKYGISHGDLPTVLLMDEQGNVTGRTGYKKMTPAKYIERLEKTLEKP